MDDMAENGRELALKFQRHVHATLDEHPGRTTKDLADIGGMPEDVMVVVLKSLARSGVAELDKGIWIRLSPLPEQGVPMGTEFAASMLRILEKQGKVEKLPGGHWRLKG